MSWGSTFDEEPGTEAVIAAEDNDDAMGARETRRFLGGLYEAAEAAALPRLHWRMPPPPGTCASPRTARARRWRRSRRGWRQRPAQRGIMDLRDIGTRQCNAAPEPSLLPLPTPMPPLPPTVPLPPLLLGDDDLDDGGRGGGFACAPARVCRRGLTGMGGVRLQSSEDCEAPPSGFVEAQASPFAR